MAAIVAGDVAGDRVAQAQSVREPEPTTWAGIGFVLVPEGTLTVEDPYGHDRIPLQTAYGVELVGVRALLPRLEGVVAPRLLFDIAPEGAIETMKQLDLRLGLRGGAPLTPTLAVYGYGTAGYSILEFRETSGATARPSGLSLGAGVGIGYRVNPLAMVTLSIGYELGFQRWHPTGYTVNFEHDHLDVTGGLQFALN
ncbi:MAG: hypothetical protein F9K40_20055 [Kofleriaceae bacterium]|nr:MAG: hypothetical protein F9K40_20055 [Kofleriaceae bacterium]